MSDFKAKMHQIRFPLAAPDPAGGAYRARSPQSLQRSPDLLAVFKGPTSKGNEGEGGREGEGKRKGG